MTGEHHIYDTHPYLGGDGDLPREDQLHDAAADCAHLALRPRGESGGYLCDTCQHELTTIEAELASSEATLRVVHHLP